MSFNVPTINKISITGTVISDPHIGLTNDKKNDVVNFRIASCKKFRTNEGLKEEYCYVSVTAWLKLANLCKNNLKKNDKVYIEGSLQSRELKDSKTSIVEILADRIQILTPKKIVIEQ
ncbi:MAG: single-stranded DNA-binding protein [Candidatus Nanoarchaeia archaeon]|jgi:single-strand DNA-binding protein|nr:single-stranded DNA-binding protein [Candidatus Nanoarchaeia archaeon]